MLRRFMVLSLLSSVIATLALALDSAAAVIGAMLLGPFMTPLLALALSVIQGRPARLAVAVAVTALGALISFGTAWVIGNVLAEPVSLGGLPGQLTALTHPSLLDLGIALTAGVAAGYATVRRSAAQALPGVAVSVTLEPPIAACGSLLAMGQGAAAGQAALNFVTNLGAIVLAAAVTMAAFGFGDRASAGELRRSRIGLFTVGLLMLAITVPLTVRTVEVVQDERLAEEVAETIRRWDPSVEVTVLETDVDGDTAVIRLDANGPGEPEPTWKLAEMLSRQRGSRVEVDLRFTRIDERRAVAGG
jgi:uncharacterized hydrophobic protein (TIGR00271 family)